MVYSWKGDAMFKKEVLNVDYMKELILRAIIIMVALL